MTPQKAVHVIVEWNFLLNNTKGSLCYQSFQNSDRIVDNFVDTDANGLDERILANSTIITDGDNELNHLNHDSDGDLLFDVLRHR